MKKLITRDVRVFEDIVSRQFKRIKFLDQEKISLLGCSFYEVLESCDKYELLLTKLLKTDNKNLIDLDVVSDILADLKTEFDHFKYHIDVIQNPLLDLINKIDNCLEKNEKNSHKKL